jgi:peptidoglycan/LPS O-acetylase OafA/YrhL
VNAERRNYYPDLDGVRAFACLAVLFGHIFDYLNKRISISKPESWIYENFISGSGAMGVCLFFVLSGFLITSLLIDEKTKTRTINLKNFYFKRILRIWPLYFAVVVTGFFILPLLGSDYNPEGVFKHLPWYLGFINNFDRIATGFTGFGNDSLGVLWSVAIEEQFYLLWPLLILFIPLRYFPFICITFILLGIIFRMFAGFNESVLYYHSVSVCGDLATGGIMAWGLKNIVLINDNIRAPKNSFRFIVWAICLIVVLNHQFLLSYAASLFGGRLILAMVFAWIIADQAVSRTSIFRLGKFAIIRFFGKISYGVYCLHVFVIIGFQKFNSMLGTGKLTALQFILEALGVILVTIAWASFSFHFFESYFLKFRPKEKGVTASA